MVQSGHETLPNVRHLMSGRNNVFVFVVLGPVDSVRAIDVKALTPFWDFDFVEFGYCESLGTVLGGRNAFP